MASRRPLLVRPGLWVVLHGLVYLLATAPLAISLMDEARYAPAGGVLGWMVLWVPGILLALVVGHLAARLERAVEGCRRPRGWLWMLHALGVNLTAHYAIMALWAPYMVLLNTLRGYPLDDLDEVLGAAMAWLPLLVGVALTVITAVAMRRRSEGRMPDLPLIPARVPSMAIVLLTLGLPAGLASLIATGAMADQVSWDPDEAFIILGVWLVAALALSLGAALAWSRVRRRLDVLPDAHYKSGTLERAAGAWGLAGGLLLVQAVPVYLVALVPRAWSGELGWEYGIALLALALVMGSMWMVSPVWVPRRA